MYSGQLEKLILSLALEGSKLTDPADWPPAVDPPEPLEQAARIEAMLKVPTEIPPSLIMLRRDIRREVSPRARAASRPGRLRGSSVIRRPPPWKGRLAV